MWSFFRLDSIPYSYTSIICLSCLKCQDTENTATEWETRDEDEMKMLAKRQITTRLSVATHSTKCHHIKMCARKIKANVHRHLVSLSLVVCYKCTSFSRRVILPGTPANPVHFTFSQDVWPLILFGRFRFSLPLLPQLMSTSLSLSRSVLDRSVSQVTFSSSSFGWCEPFFLPFSFDFIALWNVYACCCHTKLRVTICAHFQNANNNRQQQQI